MAVHRSAVSFAFALEGRIVEVEKKMVLIFNGITFQLYSDIVHHTPVDTGRARAGWMVAVGSPGNETPVEGNFAAPNPGLVLAKLAGAPLSATRFIYNNVEYIVFLEYGTPRMAGRHMVSLSIAKLRAGGVDIS